MIAAWWLRELDISTNHSRGKRDDVLWSETLLLTVLYLTPEVLQQLTERRLLSEYRLVNGVFFQRANFWTDRLCWGNGRSQNQACIRNLFLVSTLRISGVGLNAFLWIVVIIRAYGDAYFHFATLSSIQTQTLPHTYDYWPILQSVFARVKFSLFDGVPYENDRSDGYRNRTCQHHAVPPY